MQASSSSWVREETTQVCVRCSIFAAVTLCLSLSISVAWAQLVCVCCFLRFVSSSRHTWSTERRRERKYRSIVETVRRARFNTTLLLLHFLSLSLTPSVCLCALLVLLARSKWLLAESHSSLSLFSHSPSLPLLKRLFVWLLSALAAAAVFQHCIFSGRGGPHAWGWFAYIYTLMRTCTLSIYICVVGITNITKYPWRNFKFSNSLPGAVRTIIVPDISLCKGPFKNLLLTKSVLCFSSRPLLDKHTHMHIHAHTYTRTHVTFAYMCSCTD